MRHLLLLRHAEAEAPRSDVEDIARPLTERGRQQAREAAERLRRLPPLPDTLLLSPAARTRETAELIRMGLGLEAGCELREDPAIYLAAPDALLAALRACAPQSRCVLLVGHNPGLSALIGRLASGKATRDALPADPARFELPTAGLCRLQLDVPDWAQLRPRSVRTVTLAP